MIGQDDGSDYRRDCAAISPETCTAEAARLRRILAQAPDDRHARGLLGRCLALAGQTEAACEAYRAALEGGYDDPEMLSDAVQVLQHAQAMDEARQLALAGTKAFPDAACCHRVLGNLLMALGEPAAAETALDRAIALQPASPNTAFRLATLRRERGDIEAAATMAARAVDLAPDNAAFQFLHGQLAQDRQQHGVALDAYRRAAELRPDLHLANFCLGQALIAAGDAPGAIVALDRAVAAAPGEVQARGYRSLAYLMNGDWARGWAEYDWRFGVDGRTPQRDGTTAPVWDGRPLNGDTVMVWTEQGYGDRIQFLRFVAGIVARGGVAWVQAPPPLVRLFQGCACIDRVIEDEAPDATDVPADWQVPLMSLPRVLGVSDEAGLASAPYVTAPAASARQLAALPSRSQAVRVGLVWTAGDRAGAQRARDCPAKALLPLTKVAGAQCLALQFQPEPADIELLARAGVRDLSGALGDFASTAALLAEVDLLITVDTAMAHLAGAMGRNVWLLLSRPADWRWMCGRADSPWYPTVRLFRQTEGQGWPEGVQEVARALAGYVASRSAPNRSNPR